MIYKFNDNAPIYIQIMDMIKVKIIKNELKIGDKLPSVRELSSQLKVNPNTLQRVYQELEREGIVYTQRGTGTFVEEDIKMVDSLKYEMAKEIIEGFIEKMENMGYKSEDILNVLSEYLSKGEH